MKEIKKRRLVVLGVFLCLLLGTSWVVYAETTGTKVISDPTEIYKAYKDNNFPLMTGGTDSLGKFKQIVPGISTAIKEFMWSGVRMIGSFNAEMVKFLFNLDVTTSLKIPMVNIASFLATSLTNVASLVGICVVAGVMIFRFAVTGQIKAGLKVFLKAVMIFVGLAFLRDATVSNSLFDKVYDVDQAISAAIVNVNPVIDNYTTENVENQSAEKRAETDSKVLIQNAGNALASTVFYSNVYEPYLLMNYGTTNQSEIRGEGTIEYDKKSYDRIGAVLGNENNEELQSKVLSDEENSEKFNNATIHYNNNWMQSFFALFYIVVNLFQTIIFFVLGVVRIVMAVIGIFLIPLAPILLILSLFQVLDNVLFNYAKAFAIVMFAKASIGFVLILFVSYISIGFTQASMNGDIWQKIITILVYLVSPIGVYLFRGIFIAAFTGQLSMKDLPGMVMHPRKASQDFLQTRKDKGASQQESRQKRKEEAKQRKKEEQEEERKNGRTKKTDFKKTKPNVKESQRRKDISPDNHNLKNDDKTNDKDPSDLPESNDRLRKNNNETNSENKLSDKRKDTAIPNSKHPSSMKKHIVDKEQNPSNNLSKQKEPMKASEKGSNIPHNISKNAHESRLSERRNDLATEESTNGNLIKERKGKEAIHSKRRNDLPKQSGANTVHGPTMSRKVNVPKQYQTPQIRKQKVSLPNKQTDEKVPMSPRRSRVTPRHKQGHSGVAQKEQVQSTINTVRTNEKNSLSRTSEPMQNKLQNRTVQQTNVSTRSGLRTAPTTVNIRKPREEKPRIKHNKNISTVNIRRQAKPESRHKRSNKVSPKVTIRTKRTT